MSFKQEFCVKQIQMLIMQELFINFLKERAIKHRLNTVFFSADAKCKISIGEPGFPLAAVARGKKVIIGSNQKFEVADHDFSKLSIIPDAVLVHDIPEVTEDIIHNSSSDEDERQLIEGSKCHTGEWKAGKVFYAFKSMVLEGSTALRGVVEMENVLEMNYTTKGTPIPERFYLITDGGGDRNILHLSAKKTLVSFFRKYDFDEIIAIRTAAGLSFNNPVERMHARGNQGLQGVGMMRSSMTNDLERFLKKCNSNDEVRKACDKEPRLKGALKVSLDSSAERNFQ